MFKDVVRSLFASPSTRLYPVERVAPPERYRGTLVYSPSLCTGCSLCVKDCPADAIEVVILDRAAKKYVMNYRMDRCIYCGQCVVNCKTKSLTMPNLEWEHAALSQNFLVRYGREQDIAKYLENLAQSAAATKEK
jgi:formate hydrogenlyase subunit 6/NADH:ubiquinone oxidoreductase subunit I